MARKTKKVQVKQPVPPEPESAHTKTSDHVAVLPTTEQIASIAATLAASTQLPHNEKFVPAYFTQSAMDLWLAAIDTIRWIAVSGKIEMEEKKWQNTLKDFRHPFVISDQYPITRDQFLRKMLPAFKNRPRELERVGKRYWYDNLFEERLLNKGSEPVTERVVSNAYNNWGPFNDPFSANIQADRFTGWHQQHISATRANSGQKTAFKKNLNKSI